MKNRGGRIPFSRRVCLLSAGWLALGVGAWAAHADVPPATLPPEAVAVQATPEVIPAPAGSGVTTAAPLQLTLESAISLALQRQPAIHAAEASLQSTLTQKSVADGHMAMLMGPQIHYRRQQADIGVAIALAGLDQARLDTVYSVNRTYLSVLYAMDQEKVAREAAEELLAQHENLARGLKEGLFTKIAQLDVDKVKVYATLAQTRREEARGRAEQARAALREAIGLPCDQTVDVTDKQLYYQPVKVDCHCLVAKALQYRPDYQQSLLASEVSNLEICAQGRICHPSARTFAANGDIHNKVLPAPSFDKDYRPGPVAPEMPVYLSGSRAKRQERASHLHQRMVAVSEKARGLITLEAEANCTRLENLVLQITTLKDAHTRTVNFYATAKRNVSSDPTREYVEAWLTAIGLRAQTGRELNDAIYEYGYTLSNLHRVSGGRLHECMEVIPETPPKKDK
jgi:outer membrane protein TolC